MPAESKPWLLGRWSRRATAWTAGAAALIAGGSAAAVVAASGGSAHPAPAASPSTSAAAARNALDAILAKDPDLGQPVSTLISQGKLPKATYAGDSGRVGVPKGVKVLTSAPGKGTGYVPGPLSGDFSLLQMASLALSQGCPASQAPIAGAIGAAESGGDPGAQGDISLMDGTWDWSEGLWQIRGLKSERGTGGLRDSLANADPVKDAKAMMAISSGCTDWTPWSTYNNGAYLAYLTSTTAAVGAARAYYQKTGSYPPVGAGAPGSVPAAQPATSPRPASHHSTTKPVKASSSPARRPTSGPGASSAPTSRSTSSRPPSAPTSAPSKPKPTLPLLPTKKPTLPVKPPTLPIKTPTPPVKIPTSLPVPPLPTLPHL